MINCQEIDGEILSNKKAINKENKIIKESVNSNYTITNKKLDEGDQSLIEFLLLFFNSIKNNNFLKEKEILLLANSEGYVLQAGSESEIPNFLKVKASEALDFSIDAIGANAIGLSVEYHKTFCVIKEEHPFEPLTEYVTISIPLLDTKGKLLGVIGYLTNVENKEDAFDALEKLEISFNFAYEEYQKRKVLEYDLTKREALFTISKILYSSFDVNEVLKEAVKNIRLFYPIDQLQIYMTQDYNIPELPIKRLTFIEKKDDIISSAFMEGKLIVNRRSEHKDKKEIAVPLKGKQGVYGVIHLTSNEQGLYSEDKINFIVNIADIISIAFENARLYQQSNNLVNELKIINNLTKKLNESLDKSSILQFVINESVRLFNANFASFLQADNEKNILTTIATNKEEYLGNSIHNNYGYMGIVYNNMEPIIISDIKADASVEDNFIKNSSFSSLVAVPTVVNDNIIGILAVASKKPYHFSYENFRLLQLLSQHLGLALTNASLHEKLQQLAITDYLTTLYNRSYLDTRIDESLNIDSLGSILLFDIDNFKNVNDTYGHNVGDKILIQIANILKSNIRDGDIPARWGGEELVLYLPELDTNIAFGIAERVLKRVESETDPKVTISCGVATWREGDKPSSSQLIKQADQALYDAKHLGKNQVQIFTSK